MKNPGFAFLPAELDYFVEYEPSANEGAEIESDGKAVIVIDEPDNQKIGTGLVFERITSAVALGFATSNLPGFSEFIGLRDDGTSLLPTRIPSEHGDASPVDHLQHFTIEAPDGELRWLTFDGQVYERREKDYQRLASGVRCLLCN
ncbi:hypothetical protein LTR12_015639 [Friedmanniomyces endolithicus]|nr:hypothetical protein LTR12_015639 [Friedmanniomyces endolithicus]